MPLQCTKSKRAVDFFRPLMATSKRRERRAPSFNYPKLNNVYSDGIRKSLSQIKNGRSKIENPRVVPQPSRPPV